DLVTTTYILRYDQRWGMLVLCFGVVTMLLGAVLALFSVNLKRTLACSSMSQIGFILVGVGMMALLGHENALAVRGTTLHMVNHSLIKLVLFMVAGVCYMNTHKLDLNALRGYGRGKPMLMFWYVCGAWSIMGLPLGSGYVSKTLLHESIVEYIHELAHHGMNTTLFSVIEWLFLIAGGMTVAYMTKLFVVLFIDKPAKDAHHGTKAYANPLSRAALTLSAILLPVLGLLPYHTMNPIASFAQGFLAGSEPAHAVAYFSWTNLKGAVISIAIGTVIYFGFVRTVTMRRESKGVYSYVNRWPESLDLEDGLYRPLCRLLVLIGGGIGWVMDRVIDGPLGRWTLTLGALIARILERTTDSILVIIRRTLFRERREHRELANGTRTTYAMGRIADGLVNAYDHITHHTRARRRSFVETFARWHDEISDENSIIARSMSFGLLMAGLGVFLTLVYLLVYVLFPHWSFLP
ncbi:MAG: sodium:proton antiporter, partial [Ruminococcaceae bacterium]|nr:sodium:proton antiporter [Oscillospiraceae bacterium]